MENFFIETNNLVKSAIVLVFSVIVYMILKKIIMGISKKSDSRENNKKKKTYLKLITNILKYIFIIIVSATILQINGIDITSIMAGIGVISVIAGLALQDALKDVIMGLNLIMDEFFVVGDVIKIGEVEGKVISIGLKSTKLQDVNNENIYVISNRNITDALNLSNQLDIDVPLPYEQKLENVEGVLEEISRKILELDNVINCEYKGLNEFGDSAIFYKLRIWAKPEFKQQTKREANRIIKSILDEKNIEIPFMQVDIHNK